MFIFQQAKENYKLKNRNSEISGENDNTRKPQHKEVDEGMDEFSLKPTKFQLQLSSFYCSLTDVLSVSKYE